MSDERWTSPLGSRYASPAMQRLWSEPHRIGLWRRIWLALAEADEPDSWEAHYEPYAVEGDRAVAVGQSHYGETPTAPERTYHNAYLLRFGPDGRCAEFHEFYMLEGT